MKDLIGTLVIMGLCIAAITLQNSSDETALRSKPDGEQEPENRPSKTAKAKEKRASNLNTDPGFISPLSLQIFVGSQGLGADIIFGF